MDETYRFLSLVEGEFLPGFDVSPAEYDREMRKADKIQRSRMDDTPDTRLRTYNVNISGIREMKLRNGDLISLNFKEPLFQLRGDKKIALLEVAKTLLRKRYGDKYDAKLIPVIINAIKNSFDDWESKFKKVERN